MQDTAKPKTYLFTDLRNIRCGDLDWVSPCGEVLPLIVPDQAARAVQAYARPQYLPRGIRLVAQRATKTDPLPENIVLGRVIREDGRYRSWYLECLFAGGRRWPARRGEEPSSVAICHVESDDGFQWSNPERSEIEVRGRSDFDGFTVFVDPRGPSDDRYKAVYKAVVPREERRAAWERHLRLHPRHQDPRVTPDNICYMYGAVSPDGVRWKAIHEPLMMHWSDTDTTVYYDSWLGRYVMYTRLYWQERRWVGRAEAEDFRSWGPVEPVLWPRLDWPLSDDIYTNGRTEYPGSPNYHLMFPMIYHRYTQTSEIRLFSSADGICWNEVPGGPVLSPGLPGEWDSEFIVAGKDLVPMGEDRIAIPYIGTPFPHKYPRWRNVLESTHVAWAYWPRGRLCAVVAEEEGQFFTFPMTPAGREMRLNVRTHRAGEVRVGLVGVPQRSVEDCDPIFGDSLSDPVHWKGETDIGTKDGEKVTFEFRLRSAEIFGFEFV